MHRKAFAVIHNPRLNKGTAFTNEERELHGLHGILPPRISTMEEQVEWSMDVIRRKPAAIDKYRFMSSMQKRNERLFFRLIIDHIDELMPVVYTPTVGQACQEFATHFRETNGFYLSIEHRGRLDEVLGNWLDDDVRLIVVTDGERILGLGDLGVSGMGIPIGKLALYCACAGIDPEHCMAIVLDVGTNNDNFLSDPIYQGMREPRIRGEAYDDFIEEFIQAVKRRFPKALLQFEDFATPNAVALLERYHDKLLCFNDDIQGTAAVALAGLYASTRITRMKLSDQRFLFAGAGSAATGIGKLLVMAMMEEGVSENEAISRIAICDSKGLITTCRDEHKSHSAAFAQPMNPMSLEQAVSEFKPHSLIGATGRAGMFTNKILQDMAEINEHPVIFALSNPTSNAECTAEDAYNFTKGKAVFASGSPFGAVNINGEIRIPGQGNNAYIFPGLGLGVLQGEVRQITDELLIASARKLADSVSQVQIDHGCLYPPLNEIRKVSLQIAVTVAKTAAAAGLTSKTIGDDFEAEVAAVMYDPRY